MTLAQIMKDQIEIAHPYKVHVGYTAKGNDRWKKFESFEQAQALCNDVAKRTGIILTIVKE